jgi:cysteine synthase
MGLPHSGSALYGGGRSEDLAAQSEIIQCYGGNIELVTEKDS